MSYANGTPNFNLPQTVSSDKRDWSDTNQAFADVDAALAGAVTDSGTALTNAAAAQTTADGAATTAAGAVTTANAASATATSASEQAALASATANNAASAAATAQNTADGAVTTANQASATASNADTVALQAQSNIGTMSNLNTQDKTSLVAAINEVLGQIGGAMPELDITNKVEIGTTNVPTGDGGAIIGSYYVGGTTPSALNIGGEKLYHLAAQNIFTFDIDFVPANSTVSLTLAPSGGDYHLYFIPYKTA